MHIRDTVLDLGLSRFSNLLKHPTPNIAKLINASWTSLSGVRVAFVRIHFLPATDVLRSHLHYGHISTTSSSTDTINVAIRSNLWTIRPGLI